MSTQQHSSPPPPPPPPRPSQGEAAPPRSSKPPDPSRASSSDIKLHEEFRKRMEIEQINRERQARNAVQERLHQDLGPNPERPEYRYGWEPINEVAQVPEFAPNKIHIVRDQNERASQNDDNGSLRGANYQNTRRRLENMFGGGGGGDDSSLPKTNNQEENISSTTRSPPPPPPPPTSGSSKPVSGSYGSPRLEDEINQNMTSLNLEDSQNWDDHKRYQPRQQVQDNEKDRFSRIGVSDSDLMPPNKPYSERDQYEGSMMNSSFDDFDPFTDIALASNQSVKSGKSDDMNFRKEPSLTSSYSNQHGRIPSSVSDNSGTAMNVGPRFEPPPQPFASSNNTYDNNHNHNNPFITNPQQQYQHQKFHPPPPHSSSMPPHYNASSNNIPSYSYSNQNPYPTSHPNQIPYHHPQPPYHHHQQQHQQPPPPPPEAAYSVPYTGENNLEESTKKRKKKSTPSTVSSYADAVQQQQRQKQQKPKSKSKSKKHDPRSKKKRKPKTESDYDESESDSDDEETNSRKKRELQDKDYALALLLQEQEEEKAKKAKQNADNQNNNNSNNNNNNQNNNNQNNNAPSQQVTTLSRHYPHTQPPNFHSGPASLRHEQIRYFAARIVNQAIQFIVPGGRANLSKKVHVIDILEDSMLLAGIDGVVLQTREQYDWLVDQLRRLIQPAFMVRTFGTRHVSIDVHEYGLFSNKSIFLKRGYLSGRVRNVLMNLATKQRDGSQDWRTQRGNAVLY